MVNTVSLLSILALAARPRCPLSAMFVAFLTSVHVQHLHVVLFFVCLLLYVNVKEQMNQTYMQEGVGGIA